MRLRLVLAFAALIVGAGPGWAEDDPPQPVQDAINAMLAGHYVDHSCPAYRANIAVIGPALVEAGISAEDITGKYSEFLKNSALLMRDHKGFTDQQFCDYLFDLYHGQGGSSHAIEKR